MTLSNHCLGKPSSEPRDAAILVVRKGSHQGKGVLSWTPLLAGVASPRAV